MTFCGGPGPGSPAPVFLYGHSMGGSIALIAALTTPPDIAGVIVTGPLIRLGKAGPCVESGARADSRRWRHAFLHDAQSP